MLRIACVHSPFVDILVKVAGFSLTNLGIGNLTIGGYLNKLIVDNICAMMMYPQFFEIKTVKNLSAEAIAYPCGIFHLTIESGAELIACDLIPTPMGPVGKSDPFAIISVITEDMSHAAQLEAERQAVRDKFKTKTIPTTLNPVWNESFDIFVFNKETQIIQINLYDEDAVNLETDFGDYMGSFPIKLKDVLDNQTFQVVDRLQNVPDDGTGKIKLKYRYNSLIDLEQADDDGYASDADSDLGDALMNAFRSQYGLGDDIGCKLAEIEGAKNAEKKTFGKFSRRSENAEVVDPLGRKRGVDYRNQWSVKTKAVDLSLLPAKMGVLSISFIRCKNLRPAKDTSVVGFLTSSTLQTFVEFSITQVVLGPESELPLTLILT